MEKISTHTEDEKIDAKINEKSVTKRYIERRSRGRKRKPKRRDTHHRRKKLIEKDPDLGSASKDLKKLAAYSQNKLHNIVINWILLGMTSPII